MSTIRQYIDSLKTFLTESSSIDESNVARISHWITTHEIAAISAFRNKLVDVIPTGKTRYKKTLNPKLGSNPRSFIGHEFTRSENMIRHKMLVDKLRKFEPKYGVTEVWGHYVEQSKLPSEERSLIVVNLTGDPKFKDNMIALGEFFNQDSILYKPKDDDVAYFIGTNTTEWPGLGKMEAVGKFQSKVNATYMSRLRSSGFAFSDDDGTNSDNSNNPLSSHKPYTSLDRKRDRVARSGEYVDKNKEKQAAINKKKQDQRAARDAERAHRKVKKDTNISINRDRYDTLATKKQIKAKDNKLSQARSNKTKIHESIIRRKETLLAIYRKYL